MSSYFFSNRYVQNICTRICALYIIHVQLYRLYAYIHQCTAHALISAFTVASYCSCNSRIIFIYTVNKTFSLFLPSSALSGEIKFFKKPCTMDLYFYIFERLTYEKKPIFLKIMPQYKVFTELLKLFGFISIYQNSYAIHAKHTKSKIYFEGMDNTNLCISLFWVFSYYYSILRVLYREPRGLVPWLGDKVDSGIGSRSTLA